ncbi:MAG TPA: M20/M25/M40 family metallo-hydrolase [Terriglobales bacterium]|nr:M20/M25/M40 family metallo-hydrolase [Terriglobales bacterium]
MKRFLKWFLVILIVVVAFLFGYFEYRSFRMPSHSYRHPLEPLDNFQMHVRDHLKQHVEKLAGQTGERNLEHYDHLETTAAYIRQQLEQQDYQVREQDYTVDGKTCRNLYAMLDGSDKSKGVIVVGAHYDTVSGSPGADDNASGVAAVLELARIMKNDGLTRSVMFAFFPNEEPPHFQTDQMGSLVLARALRQQGVPMTAMISVESIGYYSDQPHSQKYPPGIASFYPSVGNFIGFVSDLHSRDLLQQGVRSFRASTHFPSEGAALPGWLEGASWSDHWAFQQVGVPAIMVTDTAPFRNPHYHQPSDTPDTLDYDKTARVVVGLKHVIAALAQ